MERILVSGVGRSATTLIYRQIGQLLRADSQAVNFRYEPYLWDIRAPRMKDQSFRLDQISHRGLDVHLSTPLFLDGPGHAWHDAFLDSLFDAPFDGDPGRRPEAVLVKVIRGAGRLRAALDRFPDLRIVACMRNPIDTVNSGLGMFSFFGEEFHRDDRPRFKAELLARPPIPGIEAAALPDGKRSVEWQAAWVTAFTAEMRAVARDYPARVHLICHEALAADPAVALEAIAAFLGRPEALGIHLGATRSAGPRAGAVNLTVADMDHLLPLFERYCHEVLEPGLGPEETARFATSLRDRYGAGAYRLPLAGADAELMGTALHEKLLFGQPTPFVRIMQRSPHPTDLGDLIDHICAEPDRPRFLPHPEVTKLKAGRSFGVVVTSYNSGTMTVEAVLSCLQQTLPFDEIVIVDDCSTDDSADLLAEIALRFSQVALIRLDTNLGPAAARHIGITRLGTDFVTQLDGDDLFWPTKLEGEARALQGDLSRIAFSDVILAESPTRHLLEETKRLYHDAPRETLYARLLSREGMIPRDMTFARESYFAAGGYDLLSRLYEDWELKLRLAALPDHSWHRSDGFAGTVYNRAVAGLSDSDLERHARALLIIFLRAQRPDLLSVDQVLAAFDGALRRVARRPEVRAVRRWLADMISQGRFDPDSVAEFASSRWLFGLPDDAFRQLLSDLAETGATPPHMPPNGYPSRRRSILQWKPRQGWTPWAGPHDGDTFIALDGDTGICAITLWASVPGISLQVYPGQVPLRLRVTVDGQAHDHLIGGATDGQPVLVDLSQSLGPGLSILQITLESEPASLLDHPRLVLGGVYALEDA